MSITLPSKPQGEQYEDFVAACVRALGYFTETRTVLRDGKKEILELDIVATPTGDSGGSVELFEAKKDGINFTNVFKLFGQREYLKIPSACLVSQETVETNHLPVYESRGKEMGVRIVHLPPAADAAPNLASIRNTLTTDERNTVVEVAWYQQIAKRLALSAFNKVAATKNSPPPVAEKAKEYLFGVYAGFFQPTPLARAEALYSAWKATPNLAGEAVALVAAQEFKSEQQIWNIVNDDGDHLWIQLIMHLEGTARLRIIKNALDDFITRGAAAPPTTTLKLGSMSIDVSLHALPASFQAGLEAIHKHPHALRLPYLFQVFAELLGGFLVFNDPAELAFVERLTGVPAGDIVPSLGLIDRFFAPPDGGTMLYTQKNELLCLKLTPGFVKGGGAFLRRALFGLEDYEKYTQGWLMKRWHNALYGTLAVELTAPNTPSTEF